MEFRLEEGVLNSVRGYAAVLWPESVRIGLENLTEKENRCAETLPHYSKGKYPTVGPVSGKEQARVAVDGETD